MRGLLYGALFTGAMAGFVSACGDEDIRTLVADGEGSVTEGVCSSGTTVGDTCGGGTVFTTNYQDLGILLVAQTDDLGPVVWKTDTSASAAANDANDGSQNLGTFNAEHPASQLCSTSVMGGTGDWWLPAINELASMTAQSAVVGLNPGRTYWSSTEASNASQASTFQFAGGAWNQNSVQKTTNAFARCVRRPTLGS